MARLRIKDIAEQAGVSPATVSRFLNGHWNTMSDATRGRIAAIIKQTGYKPSNAARSLRTERSYTIGVVLADIRNPYSAAMLEELDTLAADYGLSLMTATSSNNPEREKEAIERLIGAGVDGLIVNSCARDAHTLSKIAQTTSVVLLDRDIPGCTLPLVTSNNKDLVSALIDELIRADCRSCYLLNERNTTSFIRKERSYAFEAELVQRNMPGEILLLDSEVKAAANQIDSIAKTAVNRFERIGLIAINGLVLLRLIEALGATEKDKLDTLRIATFDEYTWNSMLLGGITTAEQDTHIIAQTAINLLVNPEADTTCRCHEIAGRIITRASTQAN